LAPRGMPRLRRLERNGLFLGHLRRLQALDNLADDLAGRELPRAERDVEVLGLLEARLADHLREHGGAGELLVREILLLQRLLERLTPLLRRLRAALPGDP